MKLIISLLCVFVVYFAFLPTNLEAQSRTYKQSRVVGDKVYTDYYYDPVPGTPDRGKSYREDGKIKYSGEKKDTIPGTPRQGKATREGGKIIYR